MLISIDISDVCADMFRPLATSPLSNYSLMSDYQVTLVNNKMSEFFVKFYGPVESEWSVCPQSSTSPD